MATSVGRPLAEIDMQKLASCAEKLWTHAEIAAHFRVARSVITERFSTYIEECRERGRSKLRDLQWRQALKGDTKMLIHMAKHQLREHDRIDHNVKSKSDITVTHSDELGSLLVELEQVEGAKSEWAMPSILSGESLE